MSSDNEINPALVDEFETLDRRAEQARRLREMTPAQQLAAMQGAYEKVRGEMSFRDREKFRKRMKRARRELKNPGHVGLMVGRAP